MQHWGGEAEGLLPPSSVLQLATLTARGQHVAHDAAVEDDDDEEGQEGVDEGVHPGPHLVHQAPVLPRRLAVAPAAGAGVGAGSRVKVRVKVRVRGRHELHGPDEVQVDGQHQQR